MASDTLKADLYTQTSLLEHWQGHRRITRRTIEAFPDDQIFTFSIGGMRPFGALVNEFLGMAVPVATGVATGRWEMFQDAKPDTKAGLLEAWDKQTDELNRIVPTIPEDRWQQSEKIFGQWEMTGIGAIQYAIDNEIHHRGQATVYLRALGIEPPAFYDRS